jgi:hypothetical protein
MKTHAFNENSKIKSLEVAIILSLISLMGYTLLRSEVVTTIFFDGTRTVNRTMDDEFNGGPGNEITENPVTGARQLTVMNKNEGLKSPARECLTGNSEKVSGFLTETSPEKAPAENNLREKLNYIVPLPSDEPSNAKMMVRNDETVNKSLVQLQLYLIDETESPLVVEEWMLNEKLYTPEVKGEEITSEGKKIEVWKIQNQNYGTRRFLLTQVEESKLGIEDWMTDENNWEPAGKKIKSDKKGK